MLLLVGVAGALSGCVSSSDRYPSLAIRPAERAFNSPTLGDLEQELPPQPVYPAPSPALTARLDTILAQARNANRKFLREVPSARRTIRAGRGASRGSNAWGNAQTALASLESARSVTAESLGDIDELYGRTVEDGGAIRAVYAVRQQIENIVSEEDTILYELGRGLR